MDEITDNHFSWVRKDPRGINTDKNATPLDELLQLQHGATTRRNQNASTSLQLAQKEYGGSPNKKSMKNLSKFKINGHDSIMKYTNQSIRLK
jgi:hypothetical protein